MIGDYEAHVNDDESVDVYEKDGSDLLFTAKNMTEFKAIVEVIQREHEAGYIAGKEFQKEDMRIRLGL